MITTDDLVEYGDRDIVAEIERLTRQVGEPYVSMLSNPARLIEQLMREQIPPKPPSDDAWFRNFAASTEGLDDDGDDSETKKSTSSTPGQRPNFPPPLNIHNYLSLCQQYIEELKASIIARLQTGELKASGLRGDADAPTLIERGRWFEANLDWKSGIAKTPDGVTYHDVVVSPNGAAPRETIPREYFDIGAPTAPYVAEFVRWIERKRVNLTDTISGADLDELRAWGKGQAPPLPIPKYENLRKAINRKLDELKYGK